MINLFNLFKTKKTVVTVNLAENVSLTLTPVCGGVNAVLEERTGVFIRREQAYFATLEELTNSLQLSDNVIVKKLSKAF